MTRSTAALPVASSPSAPALMITPLVPWREELAQALQRVQTRLQQPNDQTLTRGQTDWSSCSRISIANLLGSGQSGRRRQCVSCVLISRREVSKRAFKGPLTGAAGTATRRCSAQHWLVVTMARSSNACSSAAPDSYPTSVLCRSGSSARGTWAGTPQLDRHSLAVPAPVIVYCLFLCVSLCGFGSVPMCDMIVSCLEQGGFAIRTTGLERARYGLCCAALDCSRW